MKGHIGSECSKPKVEFGKRPCFICNKTGHLARNCDQKPKGPSAHTKMIEDGSATAAVNVVMCVTDDGVDLNFSKPRRPVPQHIVLKDFLVSNTTNSRQCGNRFRALTEKGYHRC